jgi:hypothetical protein
MFLGCPYRALREGKPIRHEHEEWLRKRLQQLSGKELLLAQFGGTSKIPKEEGEPLTRHERRVLAQLQRLRDLKKHKSKRHNAEVWNLLTGVKPRRGSKDWTLLQEISKRLEL